MAFAVVFPGQGSQTVGMLGDLAGSHSIVGETFAEAADVLGTDYWQLACEGPAEKLADTRVTQPLMFISGVAVWRALQNAGLTTPAVVAGHSLGEFTALVAADAIDFADGLKLVQRRAELMATAVPDGEGGMAALIGMDDEAVIAVCADSSGDRVSEAVNFNAPGQVAISGHIDALEKTVVLAKERGARKAIMLPVSVPNHSSLMQDAGHQLAETIANISWRDPSIPLVQNASAKVAITAAAAVESLKSHVYSPVQWTKTIHTMRDEYNVSVVIEAGPGKVLSGLGKRIDKSIPTLPSESPDALSAAIDATMSPA